MTTQDGGKVVSLTHQPPLPTQNTPGTHFCQRLSRSQSHSATGRIMSLKNSNDTMGNRTRDLPVLQRSALTTTPPRAPPFIIKLKFNKGNSSLRFFITIYTSFHICIFEHLYHGPYLEFDTYPYKTFYSHSPILSPLKILTFPPLSPFIAKLFYLAFFTDLPFDTYETSYIASHRSSNTPL